MAANCCAPSTTPAAAPAAAGCSCAECAKRDADAPKLSAIHKKQRVEAPAGAPTAAADSDQPLHAVATSDEEWIAARKALLHEEKQVGCAGSRGRRARLRAIAVALRNRLLAHSLFRGEPSQLLRRLDAVVKARRALPWRRLDKEYTLRSVPDGRPLPLRELFTHGKNLVRSAAAHAPPFASARLPGTYRYAEFRGVGTGWPALSVHALKRLAEAAMTARRADRAARHVRPRLVRRVCLVFLLAGR
jgi:hypothetical protein